MNNETLAHISPYITQQLIYVLLSATVAIFIYIEGEMLKKTEGRLPESKFFHVISVIDTAWFVVSLSVLYFMDLNSIALAVPVAYSIFTISGWVYGSRLIRAKGMPDSPKDLVIPAKYIAFTQSFALIFFSLCVLVLSLPWLMPTVNG